MGILGTPLGYVMWAIDYFINNYGFSLILFILLTKLVLLPLTVKQQKSTAKTMSLQPKLQELQKKHAKNKQKYQEEMMKLYEQEGVNPMGGCMPMLVQMVLLFGIIDVIYKPLQHLLHVSGDAIKAATEIMTAAGAKATSTMQIDIITALQNGTVDFSSAFSPDVIENINNFNMNFLGINMGTIPNSGWLIIIPILSGVTAFMTSWISMKQQSSMGQQTNGMLKGMMYLMPLMSLFIAFTLPAGVGLYWTVSNVFAVFQTVILHKIYTPEKLASLNDKNKGKYQDKMRKRREKMQKYNEMMEQKGMQPKYNVPSKDSSEDGSSPEILSKKEAEKNKIAQARKKMAEKYGDDYNAE